MLYETYQNIRYRSQHKVMKYAGMLLPFPVPDLLQGPGSVKKLARRIQVDGRRQVLVVTDNILMKLKLPEGFLASLADSGIGYTVYSDVQPNPTIENVEDGVRVYRENRVRQHCGVRGRITHGLRQDYRRPGVQLADTGSLDERQLQGAAPHPAAVRRPDYRGDRVRDHGGGRDHRCGHP
jgi:hypothetical protein